MDVLLGPAFELHRGIHGSIVDNPPDGIRYVQPPATHIFAYAKDEAFPFNPFDHLAVSEVVEYSVPPGTSLIHSVRTPSGSRQPWVADTDDLPATLSFGQCFAVGATGRIHAGSIDPAVIQLRQRTLLGHYLDPLCRRIIFWTEFARHSALDFVRDRVLDEDENQGTLDTLASKMAVIYPAVPLPPSHRRRPAPILVLWSGRTFADKGGALAVAALAELRRSFGSAVEPVMVGDVPEEFEAGRRGISVIPVMPRHDYLDLVRRAHIFFLPTLFESFGMALLEAAAAGAAIVTSAGRGMEHVEELFAHGRNAFLVPNEWPEERRLRAYVHMLSELVAQPELRYRMGYENRSLVAGGRFGIERRNRDLLEVYSDALDGHDAEQSTHSEEPIRRARSEGLATKAVREEYLWLELATRTDGRHLRVLLEAPGRGGAARS